MTGQVVIVGGGIIGVSIAYHLALRGVTGITILEREAGAGTGATAKATGGIRHQFSTPVNIRLSQLSAPHFARFNEELGVDIGWRPHGYLFMAIPGPEWEALRMSAALQQSLGVPTQVLAPAEIAALVPQLRVDDLAGGTFCAADGSANPTAALQGYLGAARRRGVRLVTGAEVTAIESGGGRVTGVRTTDGARYGADIVVDAAGPWVADVAALAGASIPARPFRRQVFVMSRDPELPRGIPFTVDLATGWYIHQEASGRLFFGGTDRDDRPGLEPVVDWDGFDRVATAALHRTPSVASRVRIETAYAGIRTLTPDFHGIIGPVAPLVGFIVVSACNGHGFMHSPAVGQLVAELVDEGAATTLDLAPLSPDRFTTRDRHDEAVMF